MSDDLKHLLARADRGLAADALGAVALMIILVAGLHLPAFV
jgi:hypothetical protein